MTGYFQVVEDLGLDLREPMIIRKQGDVDKRKAYLSREVGTLAANPTSDNIPLLVSGQTKSTNTPAKYTENTLEKSLKETSDKSTQELFPTTTSSPEDSPVNRLVSQENAGDLTIQEALSFLKSQESVEQKSPDIYYLKTSRAYLVTSEERLSRQSLKFSPTLGIFSNGRFSIVRTSESPRIGKECSLSDILEENVDQKYFLSEQQCERVMRVVKGKRLEL